MNKRQMLRITGGGFVMAASLPFFPGCSSEMPADAVAVWQGPQASLDLRRWVLSYALLAPNAHNLQSWRVDLQTPDVIVLRMDPARLLPATDPFSRQLLISQGTFVELLALAAAQRGHRAEVELFPEGPYSPTAVDGRPVARIRLVPDPQRPPDPLFNQILRRRTHRGAYESRVPEATAMHALSDSVAGLPVKLGWVTSQDSAAMARHRDIAMAAWKAELSTADALLESYKVLRVGPSEISQHRDGIALNDPFVRALTALGLFDRSKPSAPDSSEIKDQIAQFNQKMVGTPACLWLSTQGNDRPTQFQCGRAYARLQLAATAQGLSMHPLSQALQEYPQQAEHYRAVHDLVGASAAGQTVQMWTRLGHAAPTGPSPRRGLQAHLQS
jgi:hypothetical protein